MSTQMQAVHAVSGQPQKSPAQAIRAQLATFLGTAALFLAVVGVVYGPRFVTNESIAAQEAQTHSLLATVGAAMRQQSPECLLEACKEI